LSFAQMREYLSTLLEKDLIRYEEGTGKYKTTEKGMRILQIYTQISEEFNLSDNLLVSKDIKS
jgi:predicted transcriptional regulator